MQFPQRESMPRPVNQVKIIHICSKRFFWDFEIKAWSRENMDGPDIVVWDGSYSSSKHCMQTMA
jgi:hypothetical protein